MNVGRGKAQVLGFLGLLLKEGNQPILTLFQAMIWVGVLCPMHEQIHLQHQSGIGIPVFGGSILSSIVCLLNLYSTLGLVLSLNNV